MCAYCERLALLSQWLNASVGIPVMGVGEGGLHSHDSAESVSLNYTHK